MKGCLRPAVIACTVSSTGTRGYKVQGSALEYNNLQGPQPTNASPRHQLLFAYFLHFYSNIFFFYWQRSILLNMFLYILLARVA